jgi:uncharacterized protein GlcG (DUF336 family)
MILEDSDMSHTRFAGLAILVVALLAASSLPTFSQALISKKVLSLDLALEIAQGASQAGRAQGHGVTVVVIDASGVVKVLLRGDEAAPQTAEVTRRKAYTALAFRGTSGDQAKVWADQKNPSIALAGGVVIKAGNEVVGAIGVGGGGGGEMEEQCAKAGIAKVADKLK